MRTPTKALHLGLKKELFMRPGGWFNVYIALRDLYESFLIFDHIMLKFKLRLTDKDFQLFISVLLQADPAAGNPARLLLLL